MFFGWPEAALIIVINFAISNRDFVTTFNFLFLFYFQIYDSNLSKIPTSKKWITFKTFSVVTEPETLFLNNQ